MNGCDAAVSRTLNASMCLALLPIAAPAMAHEFDMFEVAGFSSNGVGFYEIEVADTVKWQMMVCALYDEDDKLLASHQSFTANLATKVMVRHAGDDVASARCVLN